MYAVKEIAKYKDDKKIRDKTAVEILILSTILCLIGYIIVWLSSTKKLPPICKLTLPLHIQPQNCFGHRQPHPHRALQTFRP